jgi:hypothetical protein
MTVDQLKALAQVLRGAAGAHSLIVNIGNAVGMFGRCPPSPLPYLGLEKRLCVSGHLLTKFVGRMVGI